MDSIKEYKLKNENGISAIILSYGGIIKEINTPNRKGEIENIVLNYDLNDEYWITSEESGLIIVDSNFNITSEYLFDPLNPLSLSSSKFSSKHNVEFIGGNTYIGTTNGFNFYNGEEKTLKKKC